MAPKTGVTAIADKVARYQVRQNEIELLNRATSSNNEQSSFDLEDQLNKMNNNQLTRKRLNSTESSNLKRKYQLTSKLKKQQQQQDKIQSSASVLSTITIPTTSSFNLQANSSKKVASNNELNLNERLHHQQQPKLLIMSTGSMMAKSIVNTTSLATADHLLNVNRIDLDESRIAQSSLAKSSSDVPVSLITTSSTKIFNPINSKAQNASSPKLMIVPNNSQTKTLTIPISHNVKTLQLPAQNLQNSTILYSQPIISSQALNCSNSSLKSMPGITIQAVKTTQGGNKSNNFIIMPNKSSTNNNSTAQINHHQTAQLTAGAKGLKMRQMNAKEFPVKFISTITPENQFLVKKDHQNDKTSNEQAKLTINSNERIQPTIILTNVSSSKDGSLNSLANTSPTATMRLGKNQSAVPNIIKVVPKCTTSSQLQNSLQTNKITASRQTNSSQKAITIPCPAGTTFMEILKQIPINRISPQLTSNSNLTEASKTTISITNSGSPAITKTIKIPYTVNATSESITKLFFSNVISNVNNSNSLNNLASNNSVANLSISSSSIENAKTKLTSIPKSTSLTVINAQKKNQNELASKVSKELKEENQNASAKDALKKDEVVESTA